MKNATQKIFSSVALAVALAVSVAARAASPRDKINFDIDAPSLVKALAQFTEQSGLQLLVPTDDANEARARRVVGRYTPTAALDQLLAGTSFEYEFANARTVALRVADTRLAEAVGGGSGGPDEKPDTPRSSDQGQDSSTSVDSRRAVPEILVTGSRSLNADIERSRDDIQPYVVINREQITRSGASDVAELLRKDLTVDSSRTNTATGPQVPGNTTYITLRGLSSSETLILVDGRRAGTYSYGGSAGQPDLNSIPLSAIERIEVLPVSASGIYGGSATGGVVNVVLRRDYKGLDLEGAYDDTFNSQSPKYRFSLSTGAAFNGGKTSVMLSGSYAKSSDLLARDRDLFSQDRSLMLRNNPDGFYSSSVPPLGATTNIASQASFNVVPVGTAGATCFGDFCYMQVRPNLTLKSGAPLGSSITYVPSGYGGVASDGGMGLLRNAGKYNLALADTAQPAGGSYPLLAETSVTSVRASVRQELTQAVDGFLELVQSSNESNFAINNIYSTFFLPSSAPTNPFEQDVVVTAPAFGADGLSKSRLDDRKMVGGLISRLPWGDWQVGLDHTWERTKIKSAAPSFGISNSGTDDVLTGVVDLFRDVDRADYSQYRSGQDLVYPIKTTFNNTSLRVGGAVARLPGGSLDLSVQAERGDLRLDDFTTLTTTNDQTLSVLAPRRSQITESIVGELRAPLITATNALRGLRLLEFQIAARYDSYTSKASNLIFVVNDVPTDETKRSTNRFTSSEPTFGLRLSPADGLIVRASYSEGFLPPGLNILVSSPDTFAPSGFPGLTDPRRGNTPVESPVTILNGGNPDLKPETSRSRSLGLILNPPAVQGLRLSLDWVRIEKKNNIGNFSSFVLDGPTGLTALLQSEAAIPGLVTRAPPQNDGFDVGPIVAINTRALNFARARIEEFDWSADYSFPTVSFGTFALAANATQRVHNETQASPIANLDEQVGLLLLPRWTAVGRLLWRYRNASVEWATQYYGGFFYSSDKTVDPYQGRARAPSAVYHDVALSYQLDKAGRDAERSSWMSGTEIVVGVKNLFDTRPRLLVVSGNLGYDTAVDPRMSSYYLTIRKSF